MIPPSSRSTPAAQPIELYGNEPLRGHAIPLFSPSILVFISCILGAILFLEKYLLDAWKRQEERKMLLTSHALFMQALKQKNHMDIAVPLIRKALLLRLFEVKETQEVLTLPDTLDNHGVQGEIKKFLRSLDEQHFGGMAEQMQTQQIVEQATELYHRLR